MKEMYLYLSSDSCKEIYPSNAPDEFRVRLPQALHLSEPDSWSLAILDVHLPRFSTGYKPKFIVFESTVCTPSVYESSLRPILQRLYFHELRRGLPVRILSPRYVTVNTKDLHTFDLYLRDENGSRISFNSGHLSCTLHLVKESSE
jgi:hypothetical protein